jgi:hypothetical protein
MTDEPLRVWLLRLADLLGGFTLADMDRALAIGEARGTAPTHREGARAEVRAMVVDGVLVDRDGRFVRVVVPPPPPEPKPPVLAQMLAPPPLPQRPQLALFGGQP